MSESNGSLPSIFTVAMTNLQTNGSENLRSEFFHVPSLATDLYNTDQ